MYKKQRIIINLKYYSNGCKLMRSFNTVSVPGKRVYYSLNNLSLLNNAICGNSFYIISTNNGLLDSRESLTIRNIAGEIYIKVDIQKKLIKKYLLPSTNIFFDNSKGIIYSEAGLSNCIIIIGLAKKVFFWRKEKNTMIYLLLCRKNFISFIRNLCYSFSRNISVYFYKLRIKGLGYRIKRINDDLYRFFFTSVNFFYLHVPFDVLLKSKGRKLLIISRDLQKFRLLLVDLLLLKKLSVYRIRGLVYPKQIILMKPGKKRF